MSKCKILFQYHIDYYTFVDRGEFDPVTGFTFLKNKSGWTIRGYNDKDAYSVVIPQEYKGIKVSS